MRTPHLAKQQGDAMIPAAKSLGGSLGSVMPHGAREVRAIDHGQDLRKTSGNGYHKIPPVCG
jgi:hypothetical protein